MEQILAAIGLFAAFYWLWDFFRNKPTSAPNEDKIKELEEKAVEQSKHTKEAKEAYEDAKADYLKQFAEFIRKRPNGD
jgi:hypothetical protein